MTKIIRLRALALSALLSVGASGAYAGCGNYYDKLPDLRPKAVICFKGFCEEADLARTCANAYFGLTYLSNGWSFYMDADGPEASQYGFIVSADELPTISCKMKAHADFAEGELCPIVGAFDLPPEDLYARRKTD